MSLADIVEETTEITKRASVWDNFDITKVSNARFKLEFVTPDKKGEASICEIELEDISTEIAYWQKSAVCYVLGAYPPFSVINGYVQWLWGKHGINKVSMVKKMAFYWCNLTQKWKERCDPRWDISF